MTKDKYEINLYNNIDELMQEIKLLKYRLEVRRKEFKMRMKENIYKLIYEIMKTIKKKLKGHYNYYGINNNSKSICNYYMYVKWNAYGILNKSHQIRKMIYEILIEYGQGFQYRILK